MKKLLALLLAVVLCLSLAACATTPKDTATDTTPADTAKDDAADNTADDSNASEPAAEGGKNIVWAGWSGEEEASKDIFQRMMKTYEDASGNTVTWVGWTWADTAQQLLIRTQGGEQLDLAQADIGIFNTIAAAGVLADWNEILGEDYLKENNIAIHPLHYYIDEEEFGKDIGKELTDKEFYQKIREGKMPTTIEEFEQCMADIKAYNPEIIPYAVSTKDATCAGDFMPWLWTFGGAIFNEDGTVAIDSDAAVKCVEWYQKLMNEGYIAMDTGRGEARQMFAQGRVAFYDDAVVAKGQAVNNGVAPEDVVKVCSAMSRPVLNAGDQPQSTMWGHMLVTFQNSEYQQEAAELAKTLVSDEVAMDYFENNGMPPVTKSMAAKDEVKNDAYLNGFLSATSTARLEETARMTNASEIKTIITEELQYALLGQKTAEQAVTDMAARLNAL